MGLSFPLNRDEQLWEREAPIWASASRRMEEDESEDLEEGGHPPPPHVCDGARRASVSPWVPPVPTSKGGTVRFNSASPTAPGERDFYKKKNP